MTMQYPLPSPPRSAAGQRAGLTARVRTSIAFSALALVMFSLVGWGSGRWAHQQVMADAGRSLDHLAQRMSSTLEMGMAERHREIRNLASLGLARDPALDAAPWRRAVDQLQKTFGHYAWIGVAEPGGSVVAATGGVLEGRDVSQRPWFVEGRHQPFAGDVHDAVLLASLLPTPSDGEPLRLVDVSAPILDGERLTGVLGAHLSWEWARQVSQDVLAPIEASRQVDIVVVTRAGELLLGPRSAPRHVAPATLDALLTRGHTVMRWADGEEYLTAAARSDGELDFAGLGWTVLVRQPAHIAVAAAAQLQRRIWGFGLIGVVAFGLLGWWIAGWLTAPLQRVARRAEALAGGARAEPDAGTTGGPQEVTQLAESLGTLVAQLRGRERELLALTATLEARVAERTDALEQANADLRSFSRTVSHDLKGPINSIGTAARMVAERTGLQIDPRSRQMLALVSSECERLVKLVDELLLLARVEQQPLQLQPVDMHALVFDAVADVTGSLHEAAAPEVHFDVAPLPPAQGDAVLLRQVWQNLLGNAVKFSRRTPHPQVTVRADTLEHEIVYSVRDNGTGFDMRQADRLFGVFQRLHSAADFPGTGIGLSIVKRVVSRHGGRVWAEGHQGDGACFYFALPRSQPRDASAARSLEGSAWPGAAQAESR